MAGDVGNQDLNAVVVERRERRRKRSPWAYVWLSLGLVLVAAFGLWSTGIYPFDGSVAFLEGLPGPEEILGREPNGGNPSPVDLDEEPDEPIAPAPTLEERALEARAVYVTIPAAGTVSKWSSIITFVRDHEGLNSLVMDVRDNNGSVPCIPPGEVPSRSAGYSHYPALVKELDREGYYLIARIVCFQDPYLAANYPEQAIRNPSGTLWRDRDSRLWLNPCDERNWQHIRDTALWAIEMGFHEIQLDYVRFPDSAAGIENGTLMPGRENYESRGDVIAAFLNYMTDALKDKAILSADIYGFTTIAVDDMGIGQKLEQVADCVDFISPMVYPSHYFNAGIYGFEVPEAHPYEVVGKSADEAAERTAGLRAKNRPWLQDFSMRVKYGPAEVQGQINALFERGINTFMLWNPSNNYTDGVEYVPPGA